MIGGGGGVGPGQAIGGAGMSAGGNVVSPMVQQDLGVAQQGNLVRTLAVPIYVDI